jgi:thiosulfate reductase cytochrome b subunit
MTDKKIYLFPKWLRLWHGLNALVFIALILTGLSMQYSSPDVPLIRFDIAVITHNICGMALTFLYVFFIIRNQVSGNRRHYKIQRKNLWSNMKLQVDYYVRGMFKGESYPFPVTSEHKFNPLQQITYELVMYIGMPLIIISGWGLLYPEITINKIFGSNGVLLTDILHIVIGFLLSVFLIIHIYFATVGHDPKANFRSMITGYHNEHNEN